MTILLDISIGPVQGFVSQSRRTRDLWGSSYLLAFLSAHAMRGAKEAGGGIIQPRVDSDRLFRWVCGDRTGEPRRIGSVPNHFVVAVNGSARAVADAAVGSLDAAWRRVCDAVWAEFVAASYPAGHGTEAIWQRQIDTFWEVIWTAAPAGSRGGVLARRKHWRTHRPPDEPGDKCTVMHDLQELSGFVRARERKRQDDFWERIRTRTGSLDLRDNERLCAVALVKRMFPRVCRQALGWDVDASRWPSTVYLGAAPWIARVDAAVPQLAAEYARAVQRRTGDSFLMRHAFAAPDLSDAGDFARLDRNYLHRDFVRSERLCPLANDQTPSARDELDGLLKDIYFAKDPDGRTLGAPPTYYAILLADGDRLGKLLGDLGGDVVSNALARFTRDVRDVPGAVADCQGVTVYAGGDDVLAMLPVPNALECAQKLSDLYRTAFADAGAEGSKATLSAAIVFAHIRLPLGYALRRAHRLLDRIAKDGNGRDSLAVSVLKPGGLDCQWTTTWLRPGSDRDVRAVDQIRGLVRQLGVKAAEPGLSSSLVYRIREMVVRLVGWNRWQPGTWCQTADDIDVRAFLCAEIRQSLDVRMQDGADSRAEELTASVWHLLSPARNSRAGGGLSGRAANGRLAEIGIDGLLLARFLADPAHRDSDR